MRPFLEKLVLRIFLLLIFGVAIAFLLIGGTKFPALVAARDAVADANMAAQARDRPLPFENLNMTLVEIQGSTCPEGNFQTNCAPSPLVDRSELAKLILVASRSEARVLAIDIMPSNRPTCDDATKALLDAISVAASKMIVVMPRTLTSVGPYYSEQETFWDQCSGDVPLGSEDGIFFTHPILSQIPDNRGLTGAIRPWVIADVVGKTADGDTRIFRRRTPSFSLVVSLASNLPAAAYSAERAQNDLSGLRKMLDNSGLETRHFALPDPAQQPEPLRYCTLTNDACNLEIGPLSQASELMRINFHFAIPEPTPSTIAQLQKNRQLHDVSSKYFNDEMAKGMTGRSTPQTVLLATTDLSSGDVHNTPIGQIPGGLVVANAVYAFTDAQFMKTEGGSLPSWSEIESIVLIAISTVGLSLLFLELYSLATRKQNPAIPWEEALDWAWPIALILTSLIAVLLAWQKMHSDFSNGVLSFALLGILAGMIDIRLSTEELLSGLLKRLVQWLMRIAFPGSA
ncbi:CHASE2 domain-containing protein [Agrobacterium rhizogenes]|uniref:CHASE2 domain-containing protein n=1 Tax=Rhizobium rhizogenes TaxID=359 RepID=UPI001571DDED|nr:CHASE2 domain-containing protein [Rhizobium rhizogenes]NTH66584.1 CHASE2 domain-containing protein [Rhizobium rhizogenes]NTI04706.1 CHASE2 domain-containing protein [Rhizobium rhizogenes]NTI11515.1 CHASE2 domain-containing protein [Rhizobium rhizogenes]